MSIIETTPIGVSRNSLGKIVTSKQYKKNLIKNGGFKEKKEKTDIRDLPDDILEHIGKIVDEPRANFFERELSNHGLLLATQNVLITSIRANEKIEKSWKRLLYNFGYDSKNKPANISFVYYKHQSRLWNVFEDLTFFKVSEYTDKDEIRDLPNMILHLTDDNSYECLMNIHGISYDGMTDLLDIGYKIFQANPEWLWVGGANKYQQDADLSMGQAEFLNGILRYPYKITQAFPSNEIIGLTEEGAEKLYEQYTSALFDSPAVLSNDWGDIYYDNNETADIFNNEAYKNSLIDITLQRYNDFEFNKPGTIGGFLYASMHIDDDGRYIIAPL